MFLATLKVDWTPWGPLWLVALVFLAVIVFVGWLYTIDARRLNRSQKILLLLWRIFTVIVVLLALMEPSYKLISTEKRPPVVQVVVDESLSMSLPDARDNPFIDYLEKDRQKRSRYLAAKKAAGQLIPELTKTHRVKLSVVSDQVRSIADFAQGEKVTPEAVLQAFKTGDSEEPTGNYSNLGETLTDIINASANLKLSSVFFLSDGRLTGGGALADAGRFAASRKIPIDTIGFGTVEPLPDLKLIDLAAPPEANIKDIMTVQVTIVNTLRPNLSVDLKLLKDGVAEPIATRKIVLPIGEKRIGISTVPNEEGEIKYTLTLPVFPDELDDSNNAISFHVNVVKRRLKMLFIAGAPTMEFHHMVPCLVRDKVIDVSCYLMSADVNAIQQGNDVIEELPRTPAQWNRYDVIMLYDIDPNRLSNEQENGLEQLIQNGGGLFFIAGRSYGMAALMQVRGAKMRAMLPVEINKNLNPDYDEFYTEPFHIVRTTEGKNHPMLLFSPSREKNDEVWRSFADLDFFWNHPIMGVKREAIPLLVKERKGGGIGERRDTILALMKYGSGSTAFLGIHDMWRWRFPMENYDYDQFWSQIARYLAEYRMLGSQRQIIINTDKKIYAPGETAQITLSILDPALANQLRTEQLAVTVTDEQKGEYKVMLKPASATDFATQFGKFQARRLGEHEVRARHVLSSDLAAKKALFDEKTHFNVRMQSLEFKDTTADLPALKELADQTGGTALDHTTMGQGIKTLPGKVDTSPLLVPHESYDDLWDRWYVLAVLLILGTLELWFRRNWGLL